MSNNWKEDTDYDEEKTSLLNMCIAFGGMVLFAAIICTIVWTISHPKKSSDAAGNNTVAAVVPTESVVDELVTPSKEVLPEDRWTDMEPISGDQEMAFIDISEEVTARDVTNLRSIPNTSSEKSIVAQLHNGEIVTRTGYNSECGWSRLELDGQTVYAATKFLTPDLNYHPIVMEEDKNRVMTAEGKVIIFQDCNDNVTPKEYVNLRTEPSTAQGKASVKTQLGQGFSAHRTGYSPDSGWSRLDYDGQVLYVVTSYLEKVEE